MRHMRKVSPEDSDFWLRDANGQIVAKDVNQPWLEYQIDLVKPHVQDIVVPSEI